MPSRKFCRCVKLEARIYGALSVMELCEEDKSKSTAIAGSFGRSSQPAEAAASVFDATMKTGGLTSKRAGCPAPPSAGGLRGDAIACTTSKIGCSAPPSGGGTAPPPTDERLLRAFQHLVEISEDISMDQKVRMKPILQYQSTPRDLQEQLNPYKKLAFCSCNLKRVFQSKQALPLQLLAIFPYAWKGNKVRIYLADFNSDDELQEFILEHCRPFLEHGMLQYGRANKVA